MDNNIRKAHHQNIMRNLVYVIISLCCFGIIFLYIHKNISIKHFEKIFFKNPTTKEVITLKAMPINDDLGITVTRHGFPVLIDLKDGFVSQSLLLTNSWQSEIVDLLEKIVKPGMRVLHLGGHIGFFDVLLGKLVGENGKVVVFEPNPRSLNVLKKNIMLHGLENIVEIHGIAAWSEKCRKKLCFAYMNTGEARVVNRDNNVFGSDVCMDIDMGKVDTEATSIDKIDILFMDIEGAELYALRGAEKILANSPNAIIIMEWDTGMINSFGLTVDDFAKEKLSQKYKFFRVSDKKELNYDDLVQNQHCDIAIIPPGIDPKILQ